MIKRLARANKQTMYFSRLIQQVEEYELDEFGNKKINYVDADGNIYYVKTGEKIDLYSYPVEFRGNIQNRQLTANEAESFGVDLSDSYCQLVLEQSYLKLKIGDAIWKQSPIIYLENVTEYENLYPNLVLFPSDRLHPAQESLPDINSSDYKVIGVMDEGVNYAWYLLKRNIKNGKEF